MDMDKINKADTDVSEIQRMLDTAIEQAERIHKKTLELNDRTTEPETASEEEEKSGGDVGIQLKDSLNRLSAIQRKALTALNGFV